MEIIILRAPMARRDLIKIAQEGFGDFVKAVVDVEQEIMAIGGQLHADAEAVMREQSGGERGNLWGINLYPEKSEDERVEFDSMINLKPASGNRSRGVDDPALREKIKRIITALITE